MTPREVIASWVESNIANSWPIGTDEAAELILSRLKSEGFAVVPRVATPDMEYEGKSTLYSVVSAGIEFTLEVEKGSVPRIWDAMITEYEKDPT